MNANNIDEDKIEYICDVINSVSYQKNAKVKLKIIESKIVQDADRLDALGAIGIARAFAYGGNCGRRIYDPDDFKETSVAHFYQKLLKLKDLMNTRTGKQIAKKRHDYMIDYLDELYNEINGK